MMAANVEQTALATLAPANEVVIIPFSGRKNNNKL